MQGDATKGRPKRVRITVSLDSRDYDGLVDLSAREERSLSWLVAQAVKQYLSVREEDLQYQIHFQQERGR